MRKGALLMLLMTAVALFAAGCSGGSDTPADTRSPTPTPRIESSTEASPAPTPTPRVTVEPDAPTPAPIPSGTVALFFRVNFGTDTNRFITSGGDIVWETGRRGIVRYIPETGGLAVLKTITSPSFSKSSIYPVTVGSKLFVIHDWGSDWTSDNKHFGIEELDPRTGLLLASVEIDAEWFTILEDRVYFKREVRTDLFGRPSGGGELMVQELGSTQARELPEQPARLHAVGEQLVSLNGSELRYYSSSTVAVQSTTLVDPSLTERMWPTGGTFYGDDGIYMAIEGARGNEIDVVRVPLAGSPGTLVPVGLQEDEHGITIDESQDLVLIGLSGPAPPNGIGVNRMLLFDVVEGSVQQVDIGHFVPSARQELGGGIQVLVLP